MLGFLSLAMALSAHVIVIGTVLVAAMATGSIGQTGLSPRNVGYWLPLLQAAAVLSVLLALGAIVAGVISIKSTRSSAGRIGITIGSIFLILAGLVTLQAFVVSLRRR
jgi:hypothetical protein